MRKSIPSNTLPLLFIGHGPSINAIEDNQFTQAWACLGSCIGKPRGILVISAHWTTEGITQVTTQPHPDTLQAEDEYFSALESFHYPANGCLSLAERIKELLLHDIPIESTSRGIDQGCWSVLNHFYPYADVPVAQLSMDITKPLDWHYALAQKLKSLRREGYLVIGSGNIVHNLALADFHNEKLAYTWALKFQRTIADNICHGEHTVLQNIAELGNEVDLAIPTVEHYLPLIYVIAMRDEKDDALEFITPECIYGSISMLSFAFWPSTKV